MKEDVGEILNKYNLGQILSTDVVNEGVLNNNHIILTDKGRFFLKLYKNKNSDEIKYISEIEKFMKSSSVKSVQAIIIDEINKWMLYKFIQSDRGHSYSLEDYYLMGQELGNIHVASYNRQIPEYLKSNFYKDKISTTESIDKMEGYLNQINQKKIIDETDKLFLNYLEKKLSYIKKIGNIKELSNDTLIHGDFHAGNLLVDRDTRKIIGICDWEKAQYAPRAYDLARAYLYIGFGTNTYDISECLKIGNAVLEGYRSVLKILDKEFKEGILIKLKKDVFTTWIEDKYYINNDSRANKFIKNSILTLDYFLGSR